MIKNIEEGCRMNVIDFSVMNGVLKRKWLNSFVCHTITHFGLESRMQFSKIWGE